jgi:hypothetical protein
MDDAMAEHGIPWISKASGVEKCAAPKGNWHAPGSWHLREIELAAQRH